MRVLLIGSTSAAGLDKAAIEAAVTQIATHLSEAGHSIVLLGDRPDTIAAAALAGVAASKAKTREVEIHVPGGAPKEFAEAESKYTFVEVKGYHPSTDTDAINYRALSSCHAVIPIGGGLGTKTVGFAASLMEKAVIPIGCFKGGAELVWAYASGQRDSFFCGGLSDHQIDDLYSPWNNDTDAGNVVACLECVRSAIDREKTPPRALTKAVCSLVLGMVASALALTAPSIVEVSTTKTLAPLSLPLLFLLAACIGMVGSSINTLRGVRQGRKTTTVSTTIDIALGFSVGLVTTLLYLITEVGVAGEVRVEKDPGSYIRVGLLVSIIALFAGLYIDAAFQRFDALRENVLRGKGAEDDKKSG